MAILMWRVSSVMMQKRVISLAVPAVVLMATRGSCGLAERSTLVVGNLAAVGGAQGNAFGTVRRAAAQRDHKVAPLGLQLRLARTLPTVGLGWCHQTPPRQSAARPAGPGCARHAELAEHGVGNDSAFAKAVTLQGHHGFLQTAYAGDVDTGHEERTGHREPP